MKSIETRLEKLERRQEQRPNPVTEELRVYLRKLSRLPGAQEIVRESTELMLKGMAKDSPEMRDFQRRLDDLWRKHYGEEKDGDELNSV